MTIKQATLLNNQLVRYLTYIKALNPYSVDLIESIITLADFKKINSDFNKKTNRCIVSI